MKDKEFKALRHSCNGYQVYKGKKFEGNYNPDFVLFCKSDYFLFEHETKPNRKTIVADVFKAAYYLTGERQGILVIVMTPKDKSSFKSYYKHVLPYFTWLKERTNLQDVIFVEEKRYYDGKTLLALLENDFNENSVSLKSLTEI